MSEISYIKVFLDWTDATRKLKDAEKGRLIDALVAYAKGDKDADSRLTGNEAYVFPMYQLQIDRLEEEERNESELKENRKKYGMRGCYHPNWKGGITTKNQVERNSTSYREWRTAVFQRDGYKCQNCHCGGDLQAHHIKRWSEFPEERYNVENGVTLCINCHKEVHGRK